MKKIAAALISAVLMLWATTAQATVFKLEFTASAFRNGIFAGLPPAQNPVSGSITFTAATLGAAVTSIDAVDLFVSGHHYTPAEIGTGFYGDGYLFGALANGVGVTRAATDDFYLILSSGVDLFVYATDGVFDTWVAGNVVSSYTEQSGRVPEPGSLALLLAGVAGLGVARVRRGTRRT